MAKCLRETLNRFRICNVFKKLRVEKLASSLFSKSLEIYIFDREQRSIRGLKNGHVFVVVHVLAD